MPYFNISDGLYLLRQAAQSKPGFYHYGVLDVGNRLRRPEAESAVHPVVIHQTPPTIRANWLRDTGNWESLGMVLPEHEPAAIARIYEALRNPAYDLFGHNCEQFARFVTTGRAESGQLQNVVGAVVLIAVGAAIVKAASRGGTAAPSST